jgi:hypothetical protein
MSGEWLARAGNCGSRWLREIRDRESARGHRQFTIAGCQQEFANWGLGTGHSGSASANRIRNQGLPIGIRSWQSGIRDWGWAIGNWEIADGGLVLGLGIGSQALASADQALRNGNQRDGRFARRGLAPGVTDQALRNEKQGGRW